MRAFTTAKTVAWWLLILLAAPTIAQNISENKVTPDDLAETNGEFITIDGVRLYYETEGNPANPPIILLHGFGGSTFTWRSTMPALAAADLYAVAIDLPPFGLSDKNPELSYSRVQMTNWVKLFIDELDLSPATVVGHSMGGAVAARLAVQYPQYVNRLVLVSAAISDEETTFEGTPEILTALLERIDPDSSLAAMTLNFIFTEDRFAEILQSAYYDADVLTQEIVDGYTKPLQLDSWTRGLLAFLQSDNPDPIAINQLENTLTIPVLIIWGENDTWIPVDIGTALQNAIDDARLTTYEATGHLPMEEQPDTFNSDLIQFATEP